MEWIGCVFSTFWKFAQMKKSIISAAVAAAGLLAASAAFAQVSQSTVRFVGEVTSQTCEIASADRDKIVTLPTVSTSTLDAAAKVAGTTAFTIDVTNCSVLPASPVAGSVETNGIRAVTAHFETNNWDPATQNLRNTAGTAGNVQVRLFKPNMDHLPLGSSGDFVNVVDNGGVRGAQLQYVGGYYATAAATAGTVDATATYTLAYQ